MPPNENEFDRDREIAEACRHYDESILNIERAAELGDIAVDIAATLRIRAMQLRDERVHRITQRQSVNGATPQMTPINTASEGVGANMIAWTNSTNFFNESYFFSNSPRISFRSSPKPKKKTGEYVFYLKNKKDLEKLLKDNPHFEVMRIREALFADQHTELRVKFADPKKIMVHSNEYYPSEAQRPLVDQIKCEDTIEREVKRLRAEYLKNPRPDIIRANSSRLPTEQFDAVCPLCQKTAFNLKKSRGWEFIDEKIICDSCVDRFYRECDVCCKWTLKDNIEKTVLSNKICRNCAEKRERCFVCAMILEGKDTYKFDKNKNRYCLECYQNELCEDLPEISFTHMYQHQHYPYRHYSEKTIYRLNDGEGEIVKSKRMFGVEFEVIFPQNSVSLDFINRTPAALGIGSDGSVHPESPMAEGMEIRTPKISGLAGEKFIQSLCKYFSENGVATNNTCGLHIHFDGAEDFIHDQTGTTLKNLFLFYRSFEKVIQSFLPRERRDNRYCRDMDVNESHIVGAVTLRDLEKAWYNVNEDQQVDILKSGGSDTRYRGINFHSLLSKNHLEIRYHSGTVNAKKVLEWVNLHATIMDKVARGDITYDYLMTTLEYAFPRKVEVFFELLGLPVSSQQYFRQRFEKFSLPQASATSLPSQFLTENQFNSN